MKIKVIVEKGEDGYFVAHCPSLKSCWSQGKTKEEALKNIQEAIELYLEPETVRLVGLRHETQQIIEGHERCVLGFTYQTGSNESYRDGIDSA